jgi:hypothetical protein
MTIEKQLPFEKITRKEDRDKGQNIKEDSDEVGLQARRNSIENDQQTTTLRTSECTSELSKGSKEQNEK